MDILEFHTKSRSRFGLLSSAYLIAQSPISLVNKIQKVYRSQGMQIHNRHIKIIVRQITSKVKVSEDGISNVFLPGELISTEERDFSGDLSRKRLFSLLYFFSFLFFR